MGTSIYNSTKSKNENTVKGISHIENISLINFEGSGMVGVPGFSKRFFDFGGFGHISGLPNLNGRNCKKKQKTTQHREKMRFIDVSVVCGVEI